MNTYDFCVAWNWEYDAEFIALIEESCRTRRLVSLQITPENVKEAIYALKTGSLNIRTFLDRASDSDSKFLCVDEWARDRNVRLINPREKAAKIWNKARIHYVLINAGIYTPYTIVLPSYEEQPTISVDLAPLGQRFIIKPAHGGGGEGVVTNAYTIKHVLVARQEHPGDMYLLQTFVVPVNLASRPAWFRIICCTGTIYISWWDPTTGIYMPLTDDEESTLLLRALRTITATIARICELELFSTEIALTAEGNFVVVDYINDVIDLRLQSKAKDGVPDFIVQDVASRLVSLVGS